jgi:hypothetical protein
LARIRAEAVPEDEEQQWHRNNNVITHARWVFEKPPGCPITTGVPLLMQQSWVEIVESERGVGDWILMQPGGRRSPWSWRAFVLAMKPEEAEFVVGPGLVGILLYPRPESYDHQRAVAAKTHGHEDLTACEHRPPIWDFRFDRSDGSSVLVHPRWHKAEGMEISAFDGCSQVPATPIAGLGRSDEKVTHRRPWVEVHPAPTPPPSPSSPSPRVLPKTLPQPPACAPPVRGTTDLTASKADVRPPMPCRLPPCHPAMHDVRAAQVVRGLVIGGKAAVPAPKAVAISVQAVVPAAHCATYDVQDVRREGVPAAVLAPKAEAKVGNAVAPGAKVSPPVSGPVWILWRGQWWRREQGWWQVWTGQPWQ